MSFKFFRRLGDLPRKSAEEKGERGLNGHLSQEF